MCNLNIRKVLQSNGGITCAVVCTQLLKIGHEVAAHLCKESFVCGGWVVGSKVCSYEQVLGVDWQLQHIGAWWSRQQDVLPCTRTHVCTPTTVHTTHNTHKRTTHTSTQHTKAHNTQAHNTQKHTTHKHTTQKAHNTHRHTIHKQAHNTHKNTQHTQKHTTHTSTQHAQAHNTQKHTTHKSTQHTKAHNTQKHTTHTSTGYKSLTSCH